MLWRAVGLYGWLGTPDGWSRPWVKATCVVPADQPEYWELRVIANGRHLGYFDNPTTAMRYGAHVWDQYAARHRL